MQLINQMIVREVVMLGYVFFLYLASDVQSFGRPLKIYSIITFVSCIKIALSFAKLFLFFFLVLLNLSIKKNNRKARWQKYTIE